MAESAAHADRENVTESLRRHGFSDTEIDTIFVCEAEIARRERAKRAANRKPIVQAEIDFGDWAG